MQLPEPTVLHPQNQPPTRLLTLENPAVLEQIFNHLRLNSDLLSVALTCRAFRDPALNVLWRSLDTLIPLLRLISSFQSVNGVYVFQGKQDWDRFDAYANRVKEFIFQEPPNQPTPPQIIVAQSTFIQVAQLRPCLFPALKVFRCPSVTPSLFYSSLFASPSLDRIELGGLTHANVHITDPFISNIAYGPNSSAVALKNLTLCGEVAPGSLKPLVQFTQLKSLEISGEIDLDLLQRIGTLEFLEDLVVTLPDSPTQAYTHDGFMRLKTLRITSPFFLIPQILEHMTTTQLKRITLIGVCIPMLRVLATEDVDERFRVKQEREERIKELESILESLVPQKSTNSKEKGAKAPKIMGRPSSKSSKEITAQNEITKLRLAMAMDKEAETKNAFIIPLYDTWKPCFTVMSNRWPTSLLSITISLGPSQHVFSTPMKLGLFSNLTPCEKLEFLHIKNCRFIPTDQEIRELGVTFPGIRELRLSIPDCTSSTDCFVTIDGLRALAELCPNLQALQLGMSLETVPLFEGSLLPHGLRKLSIGSTQSLRSLRTLLKVGRHINRLFPLLAEIQTHDGYSKFDWEEIYNIVQTYHSVGADTMRLANLMKV